MRASLRRFARGVDTESVMQETLLRVWQTAPHVRRDGRPNSLLRLAIRIAQRLAIDEIRRHKREEPLPDRLDGIESGDPVVTQPDPLLARNIRRCLERLPDKPRQALAARLADFGARSDRDLAANLGKRLNTFLQNVTRARRLLAACLKSLGIEVA